MSNPKFEEIVWTRKVVLTMHSDGGMTVEHGIEDHKTFRNFPYDIAHDHGNYNFCCNIPTVE